MQISTWDNSRQSIMDAIDRASAGDTILIAPGYSDWVNKFLSLKFEQAADNGHICKTA